MDKYRKPFETKSVLKFSKELQTAVQDEARRQAIDSAKKRAAAQNVDYATFAALVSMAHIQPFRKREASNIQRLPVAPAWSFDETGDFETSMGSKKCFKEDPTFDRSGPPPPEPAICLNGRSWVAEGSEASFIENPLFEARKLSPGVKNVKEEQSRRILAFPLIDSQNSPLENSIDRQSTQLNQNNCVSGRHIPLMTSDAFKREWKRAGLSLHRKFVFLLGIPPHELIYIFKVELPPSILADIIDVLEAWKKSSFYAVPWCLLEPFPERENKPLTYKRTGRGDGEAGGETDIECDIFNQKFDLVLVFSILVALTKCGRFSLSLKLVGERSRSTAIMLIDCIMDWLRQSNENSENPISGTETKVPWKGNVKDELFEGSKRIRKWLSREEAIYLNELKQLALIYST